ncbi:hypothetical protein D3C81_1351500 [compost metagenome]
MRQLPAILGLEAVEARPHTFVQVLGHVTGVLMIVIMVVVFIAMVMIVVMAFAHIAAGQQADVVAEVAVEHPDAAFVHAVVEAQGQVAGNRLLFAQVRIADFKRAGGDVGAIGIQLVEGRCAFGIAQGRGQRPDRRQRIHRTG